MIAPTSSLRRRSNHSEGPGNEVATWLPLYTVVVVSIYSLINACRLLQRHTQYANSNTELGMCIDGGKL